MLTIPDCFAFDYAQEWRYSPDGSRMALEVGAIWVWTVGTADVRQFSAVPDGESGAACFGTFMWTDDQHILALEYPCGEAYDARLVDRPAPEYRWVLLDAATGARLRCVTDEVNGGEEGLLDVVGVLDADIWYIHAPDGKLRRYDSRTATVSEEEYFDYNAGRGSAHQVSPGSPWFSAFVRADPEGDLWRGRLEVFNIESGERRIAEDVTLASPLSMMLMTPDARYLIHGRRGEDGKFVPLISDLAYGIERAAPPGERWVPYAVSAARGVLLVMVPPEPLPEYGTMRTCEMAEVPLDYLTRY